MPGRGLVVVDGAVQARAWLAQPLAEYDVLAASPDAEYELERAGVKALVPEDFYEPKDCVPLKDEVLARVYAFTAELDARAAERVWPDLPSFKPFFAFVFQARHVVDQMRFTIWRLERAAKGYASLAYIESAPEHVPDHLFLSDESAWSRAAEKLGGRALPEIPRVVPTKNVLKQWARRGRGVYRSVREGVSRGGRELVLLTEGYSLGDLAQEAARDGVEARFLTPEALEAPFGASSHPELKKIWDVMVSSGKWSDILDSGPVERRLRYMTLELAPRAEAIFRRGFAWLGRRQPVAVVGATMNWREKIFAQAARAAGVPVVVYVHGNIGARQSEAHHYNDLTFCDLYVVNGEAQKAYCKAEFPAAKCRIEVAGSAVLERLASRLQNPTGNTKRVWAYALGGMKDLRYPQYHRMPSATFRVQRAIADFFGRRKDLELIMKLYGADFWQSPIARYVADRGYSNVRVVDQPPFTQILPKADGFILDFPSTTLSEMALTGRPIVHINALSYIEWLPEALDAVSRRCRIVNDLSALDAAFGEFPAEMLKDRAYLHGYGICGDDGGNARRAWMHVAELVRSFDAKRA